MEATAWMTLAAGAFGIEDDTWVTMGILSVVLFVGFALWWSSRYGPR